MRVLFGCLAVILGAISIALASRYGYKGADTLIDAVISAVVFGAIALCAFLFDAAAVRLWFMNHRIGSVAIGLIATAALIVTFTNSLGAIAGRADAVQAQRQTVTETREDNRRELKRLQDAVAALGDYVPTDQVAVDAATLAVNAAAKARKEECENRGRPAGECRKRETAEQEAANTLTKVAAAKATTDRARKLEADIASVKSKLEKLTSEAVGHANPLGHALAMIIGATADVLTAWQQAIVAAVFELCLVGVMVVFELLGQKGYVAEPQTSVASVSDQALDAMKTAPALAALPAPSRATRKAPKTSSGNVKAFFRDHLFPADDGDRVDIKALFHTYRAWCADKGFTPVELDQFLDEIEPLCGKLGIKIEVGDDQRVYCHGVKIEASAPIVHGRANAPLWMICEITNERRTGISCNPLALKNESLPT